MNEGVGSATVQGLKLIEARLFSPTGKQISRQRRFLATQKERPCSAGCGTILPASKQEDICYQCEHKATKAWLQGQADSYTRGHELMKQVADFRHEHGRTPRDIGLRVKRSPHP